MRERLAEHHETSPALTAGDVDADWESAATVGDETPGGDRSDARSGLSWTTSAKPSASSTKTTRS